MLSAAIKFKQGQYSSTPVLLRKNNRKLFFKKERIFIRLKGNLYIFFSNKDFYNCKQLLYLQIMCFVRFLKRNNFLRQLQKLLLVTKKPLKKIEWLYIIILIVYRNAQSTPPINNMVINQ